jgi:hypothetical protein
MVNKVLNKAEIYRRMNRFLDDGDKIISVNFFAELCGCSMEAIYKIFKYKTLAMSESMQIRVSKALGRLENGEVRVMRNRDMTRELHYIKKPKPVVDKNCELTFRDGQIGLKIGIKNRGDYSQPTFEEKVKWRF